jgi:hypothetical protein
MDTFFDTISRSATGIEDLKIIGLIINSDEQLAKKFFDDIISNLKNSGAEELADKTPEEIEKILFTALYKKMKDTGQDLDETVQSAFTSPSGNVYWELINGLKNKIRKGIDELPENIKDRIDNPKNYKDISTIGDWANMASVWQFSAQWLKGLFTKQKDIKNEIDAIIKRINAKLTQPVVGEPKLLIGDDLDILLNKIILLKKSTRQANADEFKTYLIDNKLINNSDEYKEWYAANKEEIDILMKNARTQFSEQSKVAFEAYLKTLTEYIPLVKWKSIGVVGGETGLAPLRESATNFLKRWGRRGTFMNSNNIDELRRIRLLQGRNGYILDKLATAILLVPTGHYLWYNIVEKFRPNLENIKTYNLLKQIYIELCGGSVSVDEEGKTVSIEGSTNDSGECVEVKAALEKIKPEEFKDWFDFLWESLNPKFGILGEIIKGSDYAKIIDEGIFFTDLDKLAMWAWSFVEKQNTTLTGVSPEDFVKGLINEFKEENEEVNGILKNLDLMNINDEQFKEALDKIEKSQNLTFGKPSREPYKSVLTDYPHLYNWADISSMEFEQNDTRFKIVRYKDNSEFKAQKNSDGTWMWVSPVEVQFNDDGDDPTGGKKQGGQEGGGGPNPQRVENTGTNTEVEINTGRRGGKKDIGDSYINKKRMINQVNTKTLKESIRNKVLLKHEEKKYKIKKINENLRKFEENFYYGNYNKFFDKMFKLAESYKKSKLYLNEDDNVTFDSALIQSGLFKGQEDRMKQEFCNYVCNKLGLEGEVRRNFEDRVSNYPFNDIGQLFTDTDKMIDMIYKSFSDSISNDSSTPDNFISVLQSTIKPYLKTADFERNFKSNLTSVSEPIMDNARKKVDNLVMKIKELLAKEESKS